MHSFPPEQLPREQQGNITWLFGKPLTLQVQGCQINPVVLKIRDHGPALLDGECYREGALLLLERQAAQHSADAGSLQDPCALHKITPTPKRRPLNPLTLALMLSFLCGCTLGFLLQYSYWENPFIQHTLHSEPASLRHGDPYQ